MKTKIVSGIAIVMLSFFISCDSTNDGNDNNLDIFVVALLGFHPQSMEKKQRVLPNNGTSNPGNFGLGHEE